MPATCNEISAVPMHPVTENTPEAVRMMLPPETPFPALGFTADMAAEPCLTAKKQLLERMSHRTHRTATAYERVFTLIVFINNSGVISWRCCVDAMPACDSS